MVLRNFGLRSLLFVAQFQKEILNQRTNNQILALIMQLNQSNVEITPFLQFPVESKG